MLVLKDIRDAVDRPERHIPGFAESHQFIPGMLRRPVADNAVDFLPVLQAIADLRKAFEQIRAMHHRAKPREHFVVRAGERHPFAVAGFVVAVRDGAVRVRSEPRAHVAGLGVDRRQIVDHPEYALVERHVDLLACACPIPANDRQ